MGWRGLTSIVAAAVLVLGACGDGDSDASSATSPSQSTTTSTDITATTGPGAPTAETSSTTTTTTTAAPASTGPSSSSTSTATPATTGPTTSTTAAVTITGRSLDLSECAVEPRAEFRAPRMQFDGETARIYIRDGGLHLTTEAISARLELPTEWIIGELETTLDADADGTDELLFTSFGNNVLVVAVMAIDGCDLVEIPVADDTTIEPQLLHGAGGNSCVGCVETLYCAPIADGRVSLNHVSSIPTNRLLDDDYTLDDYDEWLAGPLSRQYVVRHYSFRDGAMRLDYEEWDWLLEGQSPWPNSNQVEPCAVLEASRGPVTVDRTGLPGIAGWGASPETTLEALAMTLGPPTHDTGWSDGAARFCDTGRLRVISWGDLRLAFSDEAIDGLGPGLVQLAHASHYTFEDGFSGAKPYVWPTIDTELPVELGLATAGARCTE